MTSAAGQMAKISGRVSVLEAQLRGTELSDAERQSALEEKNALEGLETCIDSAFGKLPPVESAMAKFAFYVDADTPHARIPRYSQFIRWKWLNEIYALIDGDEFDTCYARASRYLRKEGK